MAGNKAHLRTYRPRSRQCVEVAVYGGILANLVAAPILSGAFFVRGDLALGGWCLALFLLALAAWRALP